MKRRNKMSVIKRTFFIDGETGEVRVGNEYLVSQGEGNKSLYIYSKGSVNISPKCSLPPELSYANKGMLFDILNKFMGIDNILIKKVRGSSAVYASRADLYSLVAKGQVYMTSYRKIAPLFKLGVLVEFATDTKEKYIQVNPMYFTYGNKLSFDSYHKFKPVLEKHLGEKWIGRLDKYVADTIFNEKCLSMEDEYNIDEHFENEESEK
jgi:hypothetical protein